MATQRDTASMDEVAQVQIPNMKLLLTLKPVNYKESYLPATHPTYNEW